MKIHDRGFIGSNKAIIMQTTAPLENFVTRPLEQPTMVDHVVNQSVYEVYLKYTTRQIRISDFDECANIIAILAKSFGCRDFQTWYAMQFSSPYFGDTHVAFLEDIFKFALEGKMDMSTHAWGSIVSRSTQQADPEKPLPRYTANLFCKKNLRPFSNLCELTVLDFLAILIKKDNGLDTAVMLCYILFCMKQ